MAETSTSRLGLVIPTAGTNEPVDVVDHLAGNWNKLDAAIGATVCTSGTRPATPYDGQLIRETDTRRMYIWNATQADWDQILAYGGTYAPPAGGTNAGVRIHSTGAATANRGISLRGSGDTQDHWFVDYDGSMQWSSGTAGADCNLSRVGAATLSVSSQLRPGSALVVQDEATTDESVTASYAAGTEICGVSFVAPPSGKVLITVSGYTHNSVNGNQIFLSYEVRTGGTIGSGTVSLAADDTRALINSQAVTSGGFSQVAASHRRMLAGLTSGSTYNVRTMHKASGTNGTVNHRGILVEPVWA